MSAIQQRRLITLVLAGVVGLALVIGVLLGTGMFAGPEPESQASRPAPPVTTSVPQPPAKPVRHEGQPPGTIRLAQGGTAQLVRKEIDSSGTLPVPEGVAEATWWGAGLDASSGATVLAGHVNWKGQTGPFAELWDSAEGQLVTVSGDNGKTWRYRVSELLTLSKEELPGQAAELFGQGGPHRLVLVTCGGRYIGGETGYDENRIVIATPTR